MRISPRGIGVRAAAAGLLCTGFGLGYPELTVIGSTAAVAVLFAVCHVVWRPRLSVTRTTDPDRVMRGEASQTTLAVSNASRMRTATLIAYDRCGQKDVGVPLLRLRAGKETTVRYPVPTDRRGVVPIGPLRVVRRDPLGLLTMARSHGGVDTVRDQVACLVDDGAVVDEGMVDARGPQFPGPVRAAGGGQHGGSEVLRDRGRAQPDRGGAAADQQRLPGLQVQAGG